MYKPLVVCLLGWSMLTAPVCAQDDRARVGVVLDVKGSSKVVAPLQPGTRNTQVKLLASLRSWDTLVVESGSHLTYSTLKTGNRYELHGPCTVKVDKMGDAPPGTKGVKLLQREESRAAIRDNNSVDLKKYGGGSSRDVQTEYFTDQPQFAVKIEGRPAPKFSIREAPGLETAVVSAKKVNGPRYVLDYELKPGTRYLVQEILPDGRKSSTELYVTRFSEEDLQPVRTLEKQANDLGSQLELFEAYRRIRLLEKADSLLAHMKAAHPKLDFKEQERLLKDDHATQVHP